MALVTEEIKLSLFVFVTVFGFCQGEVYKVGDSAGWTIIGSLDFNTWASSKAFQAGDTLVFVYDPQYHNVLEVSRPDFHSCDTAAPIATYDTGNDSITIRSPGHYYYVCGFVGHCQIGQKVDIRVPKSLGLDYMPIDSPTNDVPDVSSIGPMSRSPINISGASVQQCYTWFRALIALLLIDYYLCLMLIIIG